MQFISILGFAIPGFLIALYLVLIFAINLHWFKATGYIPITTSFTGWLSSRSRCRSSPSSIGGIATITQQVRGSVLDATLPRLRPHAPQSRARARTASSTSTCCATPAAPRSPSSPCQFIGMLGGAVIVEQIFALPGIGSLTVSATTAGDIPIVMGVVVVTADHRGHRQPPHRPRAGCAQPEGATLMTAIEVPTDGPHPVGGQPSSVPPAAAQPARGSSRWSSSPSSCCIAIIGPFIAPYDPNLASLQSILRRRAPSTSLGTDSAGRDVLSRLLVATQISIAAALLAVVTALVLGVISGLHRRLLPGLVRQRRVVGHLARHGAARPSSSCSPPAPCSAPPCGSR